MPELIFAAKLHCGQEVGIIFFEKVTSVVLIYVYTYIQRLSRLLRARLRVLRPPKPIFLKLGAWWHAQALSFAGSFVDVALLQPLQKVGWTGGTTSKMLICESNWDQIWDFWLLFLSTLKEFCAQISCAIGLGIKVLLFGFCCMQLAITDSALEISWR